MDEVYYLKEIGSFARDGILLGILIGVVLWFVLVGNRRTVDLRRFSVIAAVPFGIASSFAMANVLYAKYDMVATEGMRQYYIEVLT